MDLSRKKQLQEEYKNRRPEMGVIEFRCRTTNESFLGASKDTKADFNSCQFKLSTGTHPNKRLQELWNQYGQDDFECSVVEVLEFKNPDDDYAAKLEELRVKYLQKDEQAKKIWR